MQNVDPIEFFKATGELHDSGMLSLFIQFDERRVTMEILQVSLSYDMNGPPPTTPISLVFQQVDGFFGDVGALGKEGTTIMSVDCVRKLPVGYECSVNMAGGVFGSSEYPVLRLSFSSLSIEGKPMLHFR
jgi:hypothetical protein